MKIHAFFITKLTIAAILLIILIFSALGLGAANTTVNDVYDAIIGKSGGPYYDVLREIRFPRVVAAFFVGAALAVSGAIMQGITRNPLAEPGLLGLTAGANLSLSIALAFIPGVSILMLMCSSFIGAAIGMLIVLGIGISSRNGLSPLKLVLAGAAVSLFLEAIATSIGILFNISKQLNLWTSGGLGGVTWHALISAPFIIIALCIAILFSKQLTLLSLNEDVAKSLGQKTKTVKLILMFIVIILAGAAVSLIGNLAFIGLFIPHIVRRIVGADYRFIIPMCIIVGGGFIVFADFLCRNLIAPLELPIIALISVVGLPFFMIIVRKGAHRFG